jgi:hypothetical protein
MPPSARAYLSRGAAAVVVATTAVPAVQQEPAQVPAEPASASM